MHPSADLAASMSIAFVLAAVLGVHVAWATISGRTLLEERVEREEALPVVGKTPMHAVYRALRPIASLCLLLGISANGVTLASLGLAALAAVAFAAGHFGVGAALACAGALADAVDGLVARLSGTVSRYGKVLDTTVDRFVDALLLGGVAVYVRNDIPLLVLVLAAFVGSSMVSYASAVLRELGVPDRGSSMRRAHRLAYLLTGATLAPIVQHLAPDAPLAIRIAPVLCAVGAIAVVGNVSAVRRLLGAAAAPAPAVAAPPAVPASDRPTEPVSVRPTPVAVAAGSTARMAALGPSAALPRQNLRELEDEGSGPRLVVLEHTPPPSARGVAHR